MSELTIIPEIEKQLELFSQSVEHVALTNRSSPVPFFVNINNIRVRKSEGCQPVYGLRLKHQQTHVCVDMVYKE